ncbi:hypothetical protein OENI_240010 [Oenococcus oeni]|nr:hypothetical protein OENI_240010 [Oenococcus oeni]
MIWVDTEISAKYKNMDLNYQLIHQLNGTYTPDFNHVKADFKDYFDTLVSLIFFASTVPDTIFFAISLSCEAFLSSTTSVLNSVT